MKTSNLGEFRVLTLREQTTEMLGDTSDAIVEYIKGNILNAQWFDSEKEHFVVIALNVRKRIIGHSLVSIGNLSEVTVHPREVFRPLIVASAAAGILFHNHPSGDPSPSPADISVTRDLVKAGTLLRLEILDHIITGRNESISLRQQGYFPNF